MNVEHENYAALLLRHALLKLLFSAESLIINQLCVHMYDPSNVLFLVICAGIEF